MTTNTQTSHGNARGPADRQDVGESRDGLPTGEGTALEHDVADPHPSTEENYDQISRPGGTKPPKQPDIGSNSYAHQGKAQPRSDSSGSGPK